MVTPTRIARGLGILGVIAFMAMATGSSIATSDLQDDPAAALAPALPEGLDDAAPAPATLDPAPALPDAAPAPTQPEPLKDLPPAPDEPGLNLDVPPAPAPVAAPRPSAAATAPIDEPAANPLPPARERTPTAAPDPAPSPAPAPAPPAPARPRASADDPDAKARSFVERNRREADEQLKALREEAAQLRARLGRVEAGIRRWEALAEALERSDDRAAMRTPADGRIRGEVQQYIVPGRAPVIIQSQPVTRSDYVPAPLPR